MICGTSGPFVPRYVMRFAALAGVGPDQFAGVASRIAFGNDRVRIPTRDLYRVWEITAHALRDVKPLAAAEQLEPGGLHVLDYLYVTADTIADAIRVTLPYAHLVVDPADPFEFRQDETGATGTWHWTTYHETEVVRELQEQTLGQMLRMARLGIRRPVVPARVRFTVPAPADHAYLVEAFGTRSIEFGADSISMTFAPADAESPLPGADPALAAILADYADSVAATAQFVAGWLDHFRVELASLCATGVPEMAMLAQRLAMSTRTLQRRLLGAGTTWRAEVDAARQENTERMLRTTSLSIESIAQRVGYSDERALRRAVHRWYGMSPNQVRRTHQEPDDA
jgi:AraC-like DNA-binding protein